MAIDKLITSTPILDGLREKGGTFYTFSSAINDIDRCSMNNLIKMQPSRFALCKLPNWANLLNRQTLFIDPTIMGASGGESPNILFPKAIQNYMENMIQWSNAYKKDFSLETPAELIWWKMLKKLKAFETIEDTNSNTDFLYKEKEDTDLYEQIIKYKGEINIINNVSQLGQSYTEILMHVPTSIGKMNGIQLAEGKYQFSNSQIPAGINDEIYSVGLDQTDGISRAIYDSETRKYETGDISNRLGIYFDGDTEISEDDFEFNCVLVYYDIWNTTDLSTKCTNLMGVLFIDKMGLTSGSNNGTWNNYKKICETKDSSGNAYVFRLNLKTVNKSMQVSSEVTINESDTVSMALYKEALEKLNDVSFKYDEIYYKAMERLSAFDNLISLNAKYGSLIDLDKRVTELDKLVKQGSNLNLMSSSEMLQMLQTTNKTIKENPDSVVIFNNITGNPIYDSEGNFIVVSPNGSIWKWDKVNNMFVEQTQY